MAEVYREKLKDPQAALDLFRAWLKVQRERLSDTDSEGPIDLAALYDEMLHDRAAAKELLDRAWKIAPGSGPVAEAYRTRGYQLDKDVWVEISPAATSGATPVEPATPATILGGGLRGKTTDEVVRQIGSKPDRKVLCGTKGQVIEQWIFHLPGQNKDRYVNFLRAAGDLQPRVISDYSLPGVLGVRK
jgi:hypothetical protein